MFIESIKKTYLKNALGQILPLDPKVLVAALCRKFIEIFIGFLFVLCLFVFRERILNILQFANILRFL